MQQKTDKLFIKACAANFTHLVHHARVSFIPNVYQIQRCVGRVGLQFNKCKWQCKKIRLAAVLNYIFSLFVMLDFRRLSAVASTRVCERRLSGLPFIALVGWLSSVIELNSYQLFIIHPITSISTPVCDLPTTGGLFVRFSSMETYILVKCLSSAKAFLGCPLQTDFPHYIPHCNRSCSAQTQYQGVITSSQRICEKHGLGLDSLIL